MLESISSLQVRDLLQQQTKTLRCIGNRKTAMHITNKGTIHIHITPEKEVKNINLEIGSIMPPAFMGAMMSSIFRNDGEKSSVKKDAPAATAKAEQTPTPTPAPADGRPITERINGFSDIEAISGKKVIRREDETDDEYAYRQWKLIASVYNEGAVLDARNTKQPKYFPWAKIDPSSGVGLSYHDYGDWDARTYVGVRLCFVKSEHAKDAFLKFTSIFANLQIN